MYITIYTTQNVRKKQLQTAATEHAAEQQHKLQMENIVAASNAARKPKALQTSTQAAKRIRRNCKENDNMYKQC